MLKLSRSKIDLYIECPRCFYLNIKYGVKRPPGYPFNLNSAVDHLLKKEFDFHRQEGSKHPIQDRFGLDAIPANHPMIDKWRNSLGHGVIFKDENRDFHIYGGIDDLWINSKGEYHVVDYKATAKNEPVMELSDWMTGYKRQMEIYQWLLRKNGLNVSDTSYFLYCTGNRNEEQFNESINFHCEIIPYIGNDQWIEGTLDEIEQCLSNNKIPDETPDCEYCKYALSYNEVLR
ncbi:PD-(D/E)XK nuclease family protein [Namhaeicola litoreus]|uniref:PD-(D/E)XK nuclease family protein n=1 Tax=Namhaeicola litoreus TaxID=1052145 RepID=A0ABW3XY43_9FLAO